MSGFVRFDEGLNMDAQINTFGNWEGRVSPLSKEVAVSNISETARTHKGFAAMRNVHAAVRTYKPCREHGCMVDWEHGRREYKAGFAKESP